MKEVVLGLIGAGRIGRLHAENLTRHVPGARLKGVSDLVGEAATRCARDFGIPKVYETPEALLSDPEIEAVLICTSTHTHAQLVCQAAAAGKHIFCEKPLALDLAHIGEALAAVEEAGVLLQVGFHRRFDPNFRRLKELLDKGEIGTPWLLKITSYDPEPPPPAYVRVSGGIFLDMTIHDFDMARFLLGEVDEVLAVGAVLVDPEIGAAGDVDTAVVTLKFATGALGVITNSRRAVYGHDQRIEVLGERGGLWAENPLPDTATVADKQGYRTSPLHHFFVERYREAYIAELRAFVDAVRQGTGSPVSGLDGKIPVVMGYAAKRSLAERRPVALSEIDPTLAGPQR
jgi:myo-inositol 2-dehydrogenase/D-chiro-inositol 1-dehydrogenase